MNPCPEIDREVCPCCGGTGEQPMDEFSDGDCDCCGGSGCINAGELDEIDDMYNPDWPFYDDDDET